MMGCALFELPMNAAKKKEEEAPAARPRRARRRSFSPRSETPCAAAEPEAAGRRQRFEPAPRAAGRRKRTSGRAAWANAIAFLGV
jgi:hypothetical protein